MFGVRRGEVASPDLRFTRPDGLGDLGETPQQKHRYACHYRFCLSNFIRVYISASGKYESPRDCKQQNAAISFTEKMKFAIILFTLFFSILLLLGLSPCGMSQDKGAEVTVLSPQIRQHRCNFSNGQFCFSYGINEDANTRVPPPPMRKRPPRSRQPGAVQPRSTLEQPQIIVTYTGFTQQTRTAFQHAVDIWSSLIRSPVSIRINATFRDEGGYQDGLITLGAASPTYRFTYTAIQLWFVSALADQISEQELRVGEADIAIIFNSNTAVGWYFGTDGNTPSGKYDFVTIVLHEIAHGLGFHSSVYVDDSGTVNMGGVRTGNPSRPEVFDFFVEDTSENQIILLDDPSEALFKRFTSGNLFWNGTNGKAANNNNRPKLYAPSGWELASSYTHLDENTYPAGNSNSLITPITSRREAIHHPGPITLGMLEDMRWTINKAPMFATDTTTREIAENTEAGINIGGLVEATDGNTDDTLTYTLKGDDAASFNIVETTGQLETLEALNYETKNVYKVKVSVDDGSLEDTIDITITVTDANDAPVFATNTATRAVPEGTPANRNIGEQVSATDEDGNTLTYSLSGTDAGSFRIESTIGQLKTRAALNYETKNTYQVIVTATDTGNLSDTITVTINVTDANDAPVFATNTATRAVPEGTPANRNIGARVSATDEDGNTLTYSLSGTDAVSFSIESTTGQLKTRAALDYETKNTYQVIVTATDTGNLSDTITVTINVTDANDAPVFATNTATRAVPEGTPANRNIGEQVSATDEDGNTLTYSLSGTDAVSFSIESTTGQLKTRAALDYETKNTYQVIVTATDTGNLSDTITVTINVIGVNEAPRFAMDTTTRSVAENRGTGVNIGTLVSAMDANRGDVLTYSLSGTDAVSFSIESTTGQLKTRTALDYETKNTYEVTVTATDTGNLSDTITVTINVTDANDAPVFATNTATREIVEGATANRNIGEQVSATDEDGNTLTYSLSGTDAGSFRIESTIGQLKTRAALNYETKNTYQVIVTATDTGNLSDTITVTINVTDANDAPVFVTDAITRAVPEGALANRNIGARVSATDEDGNTLTYRLSGTDAVSFSIESTTGQLKTQAALNYETKNTYEVTVTATDTGNLSDTITVTINVTDANDAPVFATNTATRAVPEGTPANRNIGEQVSATDEDGNTLTYSLSGTDAVSFSIESTTGQLKTRAALDYETKNTYQVIVTATDTGNLSDTITVTINVIGVNEAPRFAMDTTTRSVAENRGTGVNIGTLVSATDANRGDVLTYSLSGTDAVSFSIESATGQLKTRTALDYETKNTYEVTVTATDTGNLSDTITVTINVTDANDAPVFVTDAITRAVPEGALANRNIGARVSATDEDFDLSS